MEILKFEGGAPRGRAKSSSNKKSIRVAVAVGAVALVAVLSSTLAANISINTGSNVEFGQGIAGAAACDSSLTITPASTFANTGGSSGVFYLKSVTVADASTTSSTTGLNACFNKYIKIAAYDSSTSTPLTISTGSGAAQTAADVLIATAANGGGLGAVTVASGLGQTISTTATSFTVSFATAANVTATAGQIYKLTVESHS